MEADRRVSFVYEATRGERLDRVLQDNVPGVSRSALKSAVERGRVTVNGSVAGKAGAKVKKGDRIEVTLPNAPNSNNNNNNSAASSSASSTAHPLQVVPNAAVPFDVLHEDSCLVVVCKPKGVVTHASRENGRNFSDSLVSGLLHRYGLDGLAPCEDSARVGIVHRLDADTSGVLVVAKTKVAWDHLHRQFKEAKTDMARNYLALVAGPFGRNSALKGTVDTLMGRHPKQGTKRCVIKESDEGKTKAKRAITHWEVVRQWPVSSVALVRCRLETGRTHQIRVHMKHIQHALLCDPLYGAGNAPCATAERKLSGILKDFGVVGQFLHAESLSFLHPDAAKGRLKFEAPLPSYWEEAFRVLDGIEAQAERANESDEERAANSDEHDVPIK